MPLPHASRLRRSCGGLSLIAVVIAALVGCGGGASSDLAGGGSGGYGRSSVASRKAAERPPATAHDPLHARVARVIDGDTIDVRLDDGATQRVRLIGIDTPEKYTTRNGHVECGGAEASTATLGIASRWREVTLRPDRTQDAYDQYGRLLAYVEPAASPGTTYQQAILSAGWARVYVYDQHPFARVRAFRAAASAARTAGRGVWDLCDGQFRKAVDG